MQGRYRIRLGNKVLKRIKEKIKQLTKRSRSISIETRLEKLNRVTTGWVNYFAIADCKMTLLELDKMIRIRLRMCIWKSWKKVGNRMKQLIQLGMEEWIAYRNANTRKSYCRTAHSGILCLTLTNDYFRNIGYKEMSTTYLKRQV
jgi:hypothetical protein